MFSTHTVTHCQKKLSTKENIMLSMAPLLAHPLWSGHFNGYCYHSILFVSSSFSPAPAAAISWSKAKFTRPSSINIYSVPKIKAIIRGNSDTEVEAEEQDFKLVTAVRSNYNDIMIVDTTESRMLLLDSTHNVHSIFYTGQKWTGSYWDEFASLPAIIPKGPIAILGLGGGTAAHLMLDLWPSLRLEGWEIDEILIDKAREYLWLSNLETGTQAGGVLKVHVGDALSPSNVSGGFSGIIVDLFSDGKVLPQLEEVVTWMGLKKKLIPHGRIMVNCGGAHAEASNITDGITDPKALSVDAVWLQNSTIKALYKAFPGQLSWKRMANGDGENYLALTGPLPDLNAWSAAVPGNLSLSVKHWRATSDS